MLLRGLLCALLVRTLLSLRLGSCGLRCRKLGPCALGGRRCVRLLPRRRVRRCLGLHLLLLRTRRVVFQLLPRPLIPAPLTLVVTPQFLLARLLLLRSRRGFQSGALILPQVAKAEEQGVHNLGAPDGEGDPLIIGDVTTAVGVGNAEDFAGGTVRELHMAAPEGVLNVVRQNVPVVAGVTLIEYTPELLAQGGRHTSVRLLPPPAWGVRGGGPGHGDLLSLRNDALGVGVPNRLGLKAPQLLSVPELLCIVEVHPAKKRIVEKLEGLNLEGHVGVTRGAACATFGVEVRLSRCCELRHTRNAGETERGVVLLAKQVRAHVDLEGHCHLLLPPDTTRRRSIKYRN
eukprot:Hpha_TRINITY_DN4337_c0_g1::TRINITY_DN4337_c0_g1_i1::g.49997::m.49997